MYTVAIILSRRELYPRVAIACGIYLVKSSASRRKVLAETEMREKVRRNDFYTVCQYWVNWMSKPNIFTALESPAATMSELDRSELYTMLEPKSAAERVSLL
jgi:hypothetical protein